MIVSLFKNPTEFYAFAIHAIYAVILASSFDISRDAIISLSKITNFNDVVHTISIVLVYTILISGWIGYTRSVSVRPHTNTRSGNIRFILDLCIVFTVFYAVNLTNESDKYRIYWTHYGDLFHYVLPALFILYFVWDSIRYLEYKKYRNNNPDENARNLNRAGDTVNFNILINIQAGIFVILPIFFSIDISLRYLLFTLFSFGIILIYRIRKWNISPFES